MAKKKSQEQSPTNVWCDSFCSLLAKDDMCMLVMSIMAACRLAQTQYNLHETSYDTR